MIQWINWLFYKIATSLGKSLAAIDNGWKLCTMTMTLSWSISPKLTLSIWHYKFVMSSCGSGPFVQTERCRAINSTPKHRDMASFDRLQIWVVSCKSIKSYFEILISSFFWSLRYNSLTLYWPRPTANRTVKLGDGNLSKINLIYNVGYFQVDPTAPTTITQMKMMTGCNGKNLLRLTCLNQWVEHAKCHRPAKSEPPRQQSAYNPAERLCTFWIKNSPTRGSTLPKSDQNIKSILLGISQRIIRIMITSLSPFHVMLIREFRSYCPLRKAVPRGEKIPWRFALNTMTQLLLPGR